MYYKIFRVKRSFKDLWQIHVYLNVRDAPYDPNSWEYKPPPETIITEDETFKINEKI
jgi:hypothetical protein